jgi:hypothetical protein
MSTFEEYWKHPSDENVEKFLLASNWMWMLNQKKNEEKEGNRQLVHPYTHEEEEMKRKVAHLNDIRNRVDEDGYYSSANTTTNNIKIPARTDIPIIMVEKLGVAVKHLVQLGYPASFVLLLDECWDAIDSMKEMMKAGDCREIDD